MKNIGDRKYRDSRISEFFEQTRETSDQRHKIFVDSHDAAADSVAVPEDSPVEIAGEPCLTCGCLLHFWCRCASKCARDSRHA